MLGDVDMYGPLSPRSELLENIEYFIGVIVRAMGREIGDRVITVTLWRLHPRLDFSAGSSNASHFILLP